MQAQTIELRGILEEKERQINELRAKVLRLDAVEKAMFSLAEENENLVREYGELQMTLSDVTVMLDSYDSMQQELEETQSSLQYAVNMIQEKENQILELESSNAELTEMCGALIEKVEDMEEKRSENIGMNVYKSSENQGKGRHNRRISVQVGSTELAMDELRTQVMSRTRTESFLGGASPRSRANILQEVRANSFATEDFNAWQDESSISEPQLPGPGRVNRKKYPLALPSQRYGFPEAIEEETDEDVFEFSTTPMQQKQFPNDEMASSAPATTDRSPPAHMGRIRAKSTTQELNQRIQHATDEFQKLIKDSNTRKLKRQATLDQLNIRNKLEQHRAAE